MDTSSIYSDDDVMAHFLEEDNRDTTDKNGEDNFRSPSNKRNTTFSEMKRSSASPTPLRLFRDGAPPPLPNDYISCLPPRPLTFSPDEIEHVAALQKDIEDFATLPSGRASEHRPVTTWFSQPPPANTPQESMQYVTVLPARRASRPRPVTPFFGPPAPNTLSQLNADDSTVFSASRASGSRPVTTWPQQSIEAELFVPVGNAIEIGENYAPDETSLSRTVTYVDDLSNSGSISKSSGVGKRLNAKFSKMNLRSLFKKKNVEDKGKAVQKSLLTTTQRNPAAAPGRIYTTAEIKALHQEHFLFLKTQREEKEAAAAALAAVNASSAAVGVDSAVSVDSAVNTISAVNASSAVTPSAAVTPIVEANVDSCANPVKMSPQSGNDKDISGDSHAKRSQGMSSPFAHMKSFMSTQAETTQAHSHFDGQADMSTPQEAPQAPSIRYGEVSLHNPTGASYRTHKRSRNRLGIHGNDNFDPLNPFPVLLPGNGGSQAQRAPNHLQFVMPPWETPVLPQIDDGIPRRIVYEKELETDRDDEPILDEEKTYSRAMALSFLESTMLGGLENGSANDGWGSERERIEQEIGFVHLMSVRNGVQSLTHVRGREVEDKKTEEDAGGEEAEAVGLGLNIPGPDGKPVVAGKWCQVANGKWLMK